MSDPIPVKLSETCWCGTEVTVEGVTWDQARRYVVAWRKEHRHRESRQADHVGFSAGGYVRDTGQPTMTASPWGAK